MSFRYMKNIHRLPIIRAVFACLCMVSGLSALDFSLSPNAEGSFDPRLSANWQWDGPFGGRLEAASSGLTTLDTASPGTGLEQAITTVQRYTFVSLVPVHYRFQQDGLNLDLGVDLRGDYLANRDVGFTDTDMGVGKPVMRLSFDNTSNNWALKPGLAASVGYQSPIFSVNFSVSYAPWMLIILHQEIASVVSDPQYAAYATARKTGDSTSSSWNPWEANLHAVLHIGEFNLQLISGVDGSQYLFNALQLGGTIGSIDIYKFNSRNELTISWSRLKVGGLAPRIGVGCDFNLEFVKGESAPSAVPQWRFAVGLGD